MARKPGIQTRSDLKHFSVDELFELQDECQTPGYYEMAKEEFQRRNLETIAAQVTASNESTQATQRLNARLNLLLSRWSYSRLDKLLSAY